MAKAAPNEAPRENPEHAPEAAPTAAKLDKLKGEVVKEVGGAENVIKGIRETLARADAVRADTIKRRAALALEIRDGQRAEGANAA